VVLHTDTGAAADTTQALDKTTNCANHLQLAPEHMGLQSEAPSNSALPSSEPEQVAANARLLADHTVTLRSAEECTIAQAGSVRTAFPKLFASGAASRNAYSDAPVTRSRAAAQVSGNAEGSVALHAMQPSHVEHLRHGRAATHASDLQNAAGNQHDSPPPSLCTATRGRAKPAPSLRGASSNLHAYSPKSAARAKRGRAPAPLAGDSDEPLNVRPALTPPAAPQPYSLRRCKAHERADSGEQAKDTVAGGTAGMPLGPQVGRSLGQEVLTGASAPLPGSPPCTPISSAALKRVTGGALANKLTATAGLSSRGRASSGVGSSARALSGGTTHMLSANPDILDTSARDKSCVATRTKSSGSARKASAEAKEVPADKATLWQTSEKASPLVRRSSRARRENARFIPNCNEQQPPPPALPPARSPSPTISLPFPSRPGRSNRRSNTAEMIAGHTPQHSAPVPEAEMCAVPPTQVHEAPSSGVTSASPRSGSLMPFAAIGSRHSRLRPSHTKRAYTLTPIQLPRAPQSHLAGALSPPFSCLPPPASSHKTGSSRSPTPHQENGSDVGDSHSPCPSEHQTDNPTALEALEGTCSTMPSGPDGARLANRTHQHTPCADKMRHTAQKFKETASLAQHAVPSRTQEDVHDTGEIRRQAAGSEHVPEEAARVDIDMLGDAVVAGTGGSTESRMNDKAKATKDVEAARTEEDHTAQVDHDWLHPAAHEPQVQTVGAALPDTVHNRATGGAELGGGVRVTAATGDGSARGNGGTTVSGQLQRGGTLRETIAPGVSSADGGSTRGGRVAFGLERAACPEWDHLASVPEQEGAAGEACAGGRQAIDSGVADNEGFPVGGQGSIQAVAVQQQEQQQWQGDHSLGSELTDGEAWCGRDEAPKRVGAEGALPNEMDVDALNVSQDGLYRRSEDAVHEEGESSKGDATALGHAGPLSNDRPVFVGSAPDAGRLHAPEQQPEPSAAPVDVDGADQAVPAVGALCRTTVSASHRLGSTASRFVDSTMHAYHDTHYEHADKCYKRTIPGANVDRLKSSYILATNVSGPIEPSAAVQASATYRVPETATGGHSVNPAPAQLAPPASSTLLQGADSSGLSAAGTSLRWVQKDGVLPHENAKPHLIAPDSLKPEGSDSPTPCGKSQDPWQLHVLRAQAAADGDGTVTTALHSDALAEGNVLFEPSSLSQPHASPECLRYQKTTTYQSPCSGVLCSCDAPPLRSSSRPQNDVTQAQPPLRLPPPSPPLNHSAQHMRDTAQWSALAFKGKAVEENLIPVCMPQPALAVVRAANAATTGFGAAYGGVSAHISGERSSAPPARSEQVTDRLCKRTCSPSASILQTPSGHACDRGLLPTARPRQCATSDAADHHQGSSSAAEVRETYNASPFPQRAPADTAVPGGAGGKGVSQQQPTVPSPSPSKHHAAAKAEAQVVPSPLKRHRAAKSLTPRCCAGGRLSEGTVPSPVQHRVTSPLLRRIHRLSASGMARVDASPRSRAVEADILRNAADVLKNTSSATEHHMGTPPQGASRSFCMDRVTSMTSPREHAVPGSSAVPVQYTKFAVSDAVALGPCVLLDSPGRRGASAGKSTAPVTWKGSLNSPNQRDKTMQCDATLLGPAVLHKPPIQGDTKMARDAAVLGPRDLLTAQQNATCDQRSTLAADSTLQDLIGKLPLPPREQPLPVQEKGKATDGTAQVSYNCFALGDGSSIMAGKGELAICSERQACKEGSMHGHHQARSEGKEYDGCGMHEEHQSQLARLGSQGAAVPAEEEASAVLTHNALAHFSPARPVMHKAAKGAQHMHHAFAGAASELATDKAPAMGVRPSQSHCMVTVEESTLLQMHAPASTEARYVVPTKGVGVKELLPASAVPAFLPSAIAPHVASMLSWPPPTNLQPLGPMPSMPSALKPGAVDAQRHHDLHTPAPAARTHAANKDACATDARAADPIANSSNRADGVQPLSPAMPGSVIGHAVVGASVAEEGASEKRLSVASELGVVTDGWPAEMPKFDGLHGDVAVACGLSKAASKRVFTGSALDSAKSADCSAAGPSHVTSMHENGRVGSSVEQFSAYACEHAHTKAQGPHVHETALPGSVLCSNATVRGLSADDVATAALQAGHATRHAAQIHTTLGLPQHSDTHADEQKAAAAELHACSMDSEHVTRPSPFAVEMSLGSAAISDALGSYTAAGATGVGGYGRVLLGLQGFLPAAACLQNLSCVAPQPNKVRMPCRQLTPQVATPSDFYPLPKTQAPNPSQPTSHQPCQAPRRLSPQPVSLSGASCNPHATPPHAIALGPTPGDRSPTFGAELPDPSPLTTISNTVSVPPSALCPPTQRLMPNRHKRLFGVGGILTPGARVAYVLKADCQILLKGSAVLGDMAAGEPAGICCDCCGQVCLPLPVTWND
jgi:hypothetical protein